MIGRGGVRRGLLGSVKLEQKMESQILTTMNSEAMTVEGLDSLVTLVEHVCALPAVATLDWCDRAASSFANEIKGSTAVVLLATVREDGTIREIESIGAGKHGAGNEPELIDIRARVERLSTLGFGISNLAGGKPQVGLVSPAQGEPRSELEQLFVNSGSGVAAGVCALGTPSTGRVLCVIVSVPAGIPEWVPGVLVSILPSLSRKVLVAIGTSTSTKSGWISHREQMVLEQLILGKSVKQIADDLGRSPHTVHDHVKALHRKLNASSRGELVARALGHMMEGTGIRHGDGNTPGQDGRQAA